MKMTKKAALEYAVDALWTICYECWELQNKGKKREVKCKITDCERKAAILKLDKERCMSWTEG